MTGTGDVIDNFLLWELCKQQGIQRKILEGSANGEKLKQEIVDEIRQEYLAKDYDRGEKIEKIREISGNSEHKTKIFRYCSWEKETVKIEDMGTTLPHAMDLPPEVISGRLPEVVKFVKQADPEQYRSIKYIKSLEQVPEVLNEFSTTDISPGRIIRRQDRMNKAYGDDGWSIEDTWAAVHDGNHRTIANILAEDLEEIECYVGRPSTDKIYEHVKL